MKVVVSGKTVFVGDTTLAELRYWLAYMADFHGERYYGPLRDIVEALEEAQEKTPSGTFRAY